MSLTKERWKNEEGDAKSALTEKRTIPIIREIHPTIWLAETVCVTKRDERAPVMNVAGTKRHETNVAGTKESARYHKLTKPVRRSPVRSTHPHAARDIEPIIDIFPPNNTKPKITTAPTAILELAAERLDIRPRTFFARIFSTAQKSVAKRTSISPIPNE